MNKANGNFSKDLELNVSGILKMIMREENRFPDDYRAVAATLYDRFETWAWGEAHVGEPESDSDSEKPRTKGTVKRSVGSSGSKGQPAPVDHPIYGSGRIMDHIIVTRAKSGLSYSVHEGFRLKDFKVLGHNGFSVGTSWPLRIAAVRDGVHGTKFSRINLRKSAANTLQDSYRVASRAMLRMALLALLCLETTMT